MITQTPKFKVRLGLFVTVGLALFIIAVFLIGKQKNLFNPVFKLNAIFHNVSGLQVGSNIRFSGINVGTVDNIVIIDDSTVRVDMLIRKNVQEFIKANCEAGIGSAGIIGDRVLSVTQGSIDAPTVKDGQQIASKEPVEMDSIMASLKETADNAAVVSKQVEEITTEINTGDGTLPRLIHDKKMAQNVNQTIINLKKSARGFSENMEAAKDSFLLRGSYKRKAKAEQKVIDDALEQKAD
ncbi:MAG: MCE family protein [Deltaproteobacteria bacterium]|nr:MCE family protein [Deltaproteobacteria bacterium]